MKKELHKRINERGLFDDFRRKNWKGKAIVEVSGMDCDGVRYSGEIIRCLPHFMAYIQMIEDKHYWSEGPIYFQLIADDDLKEIRYSQRDLALEAFEDGHPHILFC